LGAGATAGLAGALNHRGTLCGRCCRSRRRALGVAQAPAVLTEKKAPWILTKPKVSVVLPKDALKNRSDKVLKRYTAPSVVGMYDVGAAKRHCTIDIGNEEEDSDNEEPDSGSELVSPSGLPITLAPRTPMSVRCRRLSSSCPDLASLDTDLPNRAITRSCPLLSRRGKKRLSLSFSESSSSGQVSSPVSPASPKTPLSPEKRKYVVPEDSVLESIFDSVDTNREGALTKDGVGKALELAEKHCAFPTACLGLRSPSAAGQVDSAEEVAVRAERFFSMMSESSRVDAAKETEARIDRRTFVNSMKELAEIANGLDGLSAKQFMEVLLLAFERFDENGDGRLSPEEFAAALTALGLELSPSSQGRLHALLDTDGDGYIEHEAANVSQLERFMKAFQASMQYQIDTKAQKIMPLVESLQPAAQAAAEVAAAAAATVTGASDSDSTEASASDNVKEEVAKEIVPKTQGLEEMSKAFQDFCQKTSSALVERAEAVADAVECGLDMTGVALALQGVTRELGSVDCWEQVNIGDLSPFLVFLCVSGLHMAREVNRSHPEKDLAADEALLYVQSFQAHGFSVAEFRELLEAGFSWCDAKKGSVLEDSEQLRILIRGTGQAVKGWITTDEQQPSLTTKEKSIKRVGPGTVLGGEGILADGPTSLQIRFQARSACRYAAWDAAQLKEHLDRHPGIKRRMQSLLESRSSPRRKVSGKETQVDEAESDDMVKFSPEKVFDDVAKGGDTLELKGLQAALRIFLQRHHKELQLQATDEVVSQMSKTLLADGTGVSRDDFTVKLQALAAALASQPRGLSVKQVQQLATSALEYLKAREPGNTCESERAAMELPDLGRLARAFQSAMEEQCRRKGLDRVGSALQALASGVMASVLPEVEAAAAAGEAASCSPVTALEETAQMPLKVVQDGFGCINDIMNQPEMVQELLQSSLDAAALLTASSRLALELCGLESWSDFDASTVVPLLVFVGLSAVYTARDLAEGDSKVQVAANVGHIYPARTRFQTH